MVTSPGSHSVMGYRQTETPIEGKGGLKLPRSLGENDITSTFNTSQIIHEDATMFFHCGVAIVVQKESSSEDHPCWRDPGNIESLIARKIALGQWKDGVVYVAIEALEFYSR